MPSATSPANTSDLSDSDSVFSSVDNSTEQDNETQPPIRGDVASHEMEYMHGKSYFEYHLMATVKATWDAQPFTFNPRTKFESLVRQYNYGEGLNLVSEKLLSMNHMPSHRNYSDDCEELMCMISRAVHLKVRPATDALRASLRRFCGEDGDSSGTERIAREPDREQAHLLAKYFVALKEIADRQGWTLRFSVNELPGYPSRFKARLQYQGRTFENIASTKKGAKHGAAKLAYISSRYPLISLAEV